MNRGGIAATAAIVVVFAIVGAARLTTVWMGKQPDGSFLVSSGQRIEGDSIAFDGRPIDLALHPVLEIFAVLNKTNVFLADRSGVIKESLAPLGSDAGFRGLVWSPDARTLFASTSKGHIQTFRYHDKKLAVDRKIAIAISTENPVPGGMTLTRDGSTLFVAAANRNAVVEIDSAKGTIIREHPVQTLPFEPRLSEDERYLIVSDWGGRIPKPGDRTAKSQKLEVVVDDRGAPASGSVSIIDRKTGTTKHIEVGIHPTAIVVSAGKAYVACAMSDTVVEIDIADGTLARTIPLAWGNLRVLGGMPNALAIRDRTLYVADGGDNAIAEIDLATGKVMGFRHAGYFPTAIALSKDGKEAYVLNTKGNGSVRNVLLGKPGNAHDFQGTATVVDLSRDLAAETAIVARNNRWNADPRRPTLKVYNGAIKHVIYIIKENRTYDEVFGDLPIGNGDAKLCGLGEKATPNHRKLAREFTLFDDAYVSGTNSADGHAWSTQCLANDYLEHFYVGYSRTYADDGDDPMSIAHTGALWDAAAKKHKSIRVYGEFCDNELAGFDPKPKDWFEVWDDRKNGGGKFKFTANTTVDGLRPYINRQVHYWPLLQSDQYRADVFIKEYQEFCKKDSVPDLTILSLPCDHSEGLDPKYPSPRAMIADNDLALGRVVEAVSHGPKWRETVVFVVEDDSQSGPDHVDGHRTVYMVISPYVKRRFVDSTFYTQTNMIKSIEMILGLDPMNKFDAVADPITACFTDTLDATPYVSTPNNVPLDERNITGAAMSELDRFWRDQSLALDWSKIDGPDSYVLNRVIWHSLFRGTRPYPARPGERPGAVDRDDD